MALTTRPGLPSPQIGTVQDTVPLVAAFFQEMLPFPSFQAVLRVVGGSEAGAWRQGSHGVLPVPQWVCLTPIPLSREERCPVGTARYVLASS